MDLALVGEHRISGDFFACHDVLVMNHVSQSAALRPVKIPILVYKSKY